MSPGRRMLCVEQHVEELALGSNGVIPDESEGQMSYIWVIVKHEQTH